MASSVGKKLNSLELNWTQYCMPFQFQSSFVLFGHGSHDRCRL